MRLPKVINTNLPPIFHQTVEDRRYDHVMTDYWSNFRYRHGSASL